MHDPSRATALPVLASVAVGAFVSLVVTGLLMASYYRPDAERIRDDSGREQTVYLASDTRLDAFGDTVRRRGDWYAAETDVTDSRDGRMRGDVRLFDSAIAVPKSWYSVNVSLQRGTEYGSLIRSAHARATDLMVIDVAVVLLILMVRGLRRTVIASSWYVSVGMYVLILISAWSGSILPWDTRSHQAFGIGTHLLSDYVPVLGALVSGYLWASPRFHEPDLMRVFLLHALVLAPIFAISLRSLVQRLASGALNRTAVLAGAGLPWALTMIHGIGSTAERGLDVGSANVVPEWYLSVPSTMLKSMPEDFVVTVLGCGLGAVLLFGSSNLSPFVGRIVRIVTLVFTSVYVVLQMWSVADLLGR